MKHSPALEDLGYGDLACKGSEVGARAICSVVLTPGMKWQLTRDESPTPLAI